MNFAEQVRRAAEESIVKTLKSGDWLKVGFGDRMTVTPGNLREVYQSVDMVRVGEIPKVKIEQKVADAIFNNLATEVATDVKKIMSNTELREDCRAVIRDKIRQASKGLE